MNGFDTAGLQAAVSRLRHRLPQLNRHHGASQPSASEGPHIDDRLPVWLRDVAAQAILAPLTDVEVQFGALSDPDDREEFGDQWFLLDLTPGQATYDDVITERLLNRYTPIGGSLTLPGATLAVSRDGVDHAVYTYDIESVHDEISDGRDPTCVVGELFTDLTELIDAITDTRAAGTT